MSDLSKPLETGYEFDVSKFVSKGYKIMKAEMGTFIGMTVVFFLIKLVMWVLPFISLFGGLMDNILYAGYFIYCRNILLKKQESSDLFKGFEFSGQIFLHLLVYVLFIIPFIVLIFTAVMPWDVWSELISESMSGGGTTTSISPDGLFSNNWLALISGIVCMIGVIYLSVSYIFTIPLIVDGKLGFWEAMELSRKVVGMKFFTVFGWLFLGGIILAVGIGFTCLIASIFLVPLAHCILFASYNDIFKPHENEMQSNLEMFGQNDEDINTESQEKGFY